MLKWLAPAGLDDRFQRAKEQRMNSDQIKNNSDRTEDDIFFYKVSDEAIEQAAEVSGPRSFTLGNCTGLGSCPA
jgi:hypothetical protein